MVVVGVVSLLSEHIDLIIVSCGRFINQLFIHEQLNIIFFSSIKFFKLPYSLSTIDGIQEIEVSTISMHLS